MFRHFISLCVLDKISRKVSVEDELRWPQRNTRKNQALHRNNGSCQLTDGSIRRYLDMTNHEAPVPSEVNSMIEEFCYTRCPYVDCQAVFYD